MKQRNRKRRFLYSHQVLTVRVPAAVAELLAQRRPTPANVASALRQFAELVRAGRKDMLSAPT